MARRRKPSLPVIHDRRATDIPLNAKVSADEVEDPFEEGARIVVLRSHRDDPLGDMYARSVITDLQFRAGRKWQRYWELWECGARGIDTTREYVDGGASYVNLTARQVEAHGELQAARLVLGMEGEVILTDVLGRGLTVSEVARKRGLSTARELDYVSRRFREALDSVGKLWGIINRD